MYNTLITFPIFLLEILGIFIIGLVVFYTVTRLIAVAWYKTKRDFKDLDDHNEED